MTSLDRMRKRQKKISAVPQPNNLKPKQRFRARLPDGSRYDIAPYSAKTESWSAKLLIPGCPTFEATSRTLFGLLQFLDGKYRKWLKKNPVDGEKEKG